MSTPHYERCLLTNEITTPVTMETSSYDSTTMETGYESTIKEEMFL